MDLGDLFMKPDDDDLIMDDEIDELDTTITLKDTAGNEVEFEFLDDIDYDGKEYIVLLPVEVTESEVVIFRIESEGGYDSYFDVDDEEAQKVFGIFKERNKDEYDFID